MKSCDLTDVNTEYVTNYNCSINNDGDNSLVNVAVDFAKEIASDLMIRTILYSKQGDTYKKFMIDTEVDACKFKENKMAASLIKQSAFDMKRLQGAIHDCPYKVKPIQIM